MALSPQSAAANCHFALAADVCCCTVNRVAEAGIVALATALGAGSCPSLQDLNIGGEWAVGARQLITVNGT
jgi:hypothetical protein